MTFESTAFETTLTGATGAHLELVPGLEGGGLVVAGDRGDDAAGGDVRMASVTGLFRQLQHLRDAAFVGRHALRVVGKTGLLKQKSGVDPRARPAASDSCSVSGMLHDTTSAFSATFSRKIPSTKAEVWTTQKKVSACALVTWLTQAALLTLFFLSGGGAHTHQVLDVLVLGRHSPWSDIRVCRRSDAPQPFRGAGACSRCLMR